MARSKQQARKSKGGGVGGGGGGGKNNNNERGGGGDAIVPGIKASPIKRGGRGSKAARGGGGGGRGGGGRGGGGGAMKKKEEPKTTAELDAELDEYFLTSGNSNKIAAKKLDNAMDDYRAKKGNDEVGVKEGEKAASEVGGDSSYSMMNENVNKWEDCFVFYAPLPDEKLPAVNSAAYEFSKRACELLRETTTNDPVIHGPISDEVEDGVSHMMGFLGEPFHMECVNTLCVLIISCDADGSVHENVRKFTEELGEYAHDNRDNAIRLDITEGNQLVVILLGHAVCSDAAMRTESEIYRHGRELAYFLLEEDNNNQGDSNNQGDKVSQSNIWNKSEGLLLEIQVELEDPKDKFDPFILGVRGSGSAEY